MKAAVFYSYGTPEVISIEEAQKPKPKKNQVLVKIYAASVNDWDWGMLRGNPWVNRIIAGGFRKPKIGIPGCDMAGSVETVGSHVTQLKTGDEVFGDLSASGFGTFAEYVCVPEHTLKLKPAGMTFEQAAAMPQAAALAIQCIRVDKQIQPGQKVLVNGAGGGAGTFTLQLAKLHGAVVTGVDNALKLETMRAAGADHVIDYTQEDFTKNGESYDLILDHAAHHSIFDCRKSLSPEGSYIMIGGSSKHIIQAMLFAPIISIFGKKKMKILGHKPNKYLEDVIALFEDGKLTPVIDRSYSLDETAKAMSYFGEGRAKGKVVINMEGQ